MPAEAIAAPAPASPAAASPSPNAAKPAAAAPAAKPASETPQRDDAYSRLEKFAQEGDNKGNEAPKPGADAGVVEPEPIEEPAAEAAKPGEPEKPKQPEKAATLRAKYDETKTALAAANTKIKELETKLDTPSVDPELPKVKETLAQREKRLAELEDDLRFTNYERSPEYKDKYEKPFIDAYSAGRNKVASFKLANEDGTTRQGTPEDFDAFMRITDDNDAAEKAVEMFGNKASMVMYHREQVQTKNSERNAALEDYRKNGAEREKQRGEQHSAASKKLIADASATWLKHQQEPIAKNPHLFAPIEGDTKGNELLEQGFKESREAFSNLNALDSRLTPEQREAVIEKHAVVFNKAAAFDRTWHQLSTVRKQVKELTKKLEAYEKSEPGNGDGKGKVNGNGAATLAEGTAGRMQKFAR